jgi:2-iminoacetate synthase ThiH
MAGSKEESPSMKTKEICRLIREAGLIPVERDSLYNPVFYPPSLLKGG